MSRRRNVLLQVVALQNIRQLDGVGVRRIVDVNVSLRQLRMVLNILPIYPADH
jgi:hypothetical protein